ncbi:MAG: DUF2752 domain-containing protein [Cyanobacteria bacterium]|nr:DUF2752 domain-containing protein [Cyanobacteriota bacterium]
MERRIAAIGGWVSIAALAVLSATNPESVAAWTVICPFKRFLDVECWGCGLTRATSDALHGRFSDAIALNQLVVAALPIMIALALWVLVRTARRITVLAWPTSAKSPA